MGVFGVHVKLGVHNHAQLAIAIITIPGFVDKASIRKESTCLCHTLLYACLHIHDETE